MKTLAALLLVLLLLPACSAREWTPLTSAEGGFRVEMPGEPAREVLTVNTAIGPIELTTFALEERERAFVVSFADYPEEHVRARGPAELLDGARDGAVANLQGRLLTELLIEHEGHPGREFRIEVPGGTATSQVRMFLVENRLYQMVVVTPREQAFSEDVARFLDSFGLG